MATADLNVPGVVERLVAMPKAELHLHLDGSLRLATIAELARHHGITLPVPEERLAEVCMVDESCRSLVDFLSRFALPVAVLQTPDSLERATYELCEDVARENVRYVEIRFGPSLHIQRGMTLDDAIAAVVRGWHAGRHDFRLSGGILLCALRHFPAEETLRVARAGLRFLGNGVVGFDLAGDEANYPILLHKQPLLWAQAQGYGMTAHAGEAAGAQSVRDAVEVIGVSRIGHGTRAGEDRTLLTELRDRRITLDMCPTSNVQTHAVSCLQAHTLRQYYRFGIPITVSTDNRTVSNTTLTKDLTLVQRHLEMTLAELAHITLMAVDAGFGEPAERIALRSEISREMERLGILTVPES